MIRVRETLYEAVKPTKEEVEWRRQYRADRKSSKASEDAQRAIERAQPGYVKPKPMYPVYRSPKPTKEEAERRRYAREQKRSERNRAAAEKWITDENNVYYRGSADEVILRTVLSKFNLWDSVPGNFIEINAQKKHSSRYSGSVEFNDVKAEGYIEIKSPSKSEKRVNIDQEFDDIHVSSSGYDHHYYDY